MSTNETPTIHLTLDPFAAQTTAAVEAAAAAPAPTAEDVAKLAEAHLTDAEKKAVEEFAAKIDITDTATVLQYGAGTQQKIADFSDAALQNVRTKDFGEMGDMMANLVGELKTSAREYKEKFAALLASHKELLDKTDDL